MRERVLRDAPSRGSSTLSKNMRLLSSDNWVGAAVEVHFAGRSGGVTRNEQPVIRALLKALPQKVLIGDSGERDPEVYAQIQAEFPDRVLATSIHHVRRAQDPKRLRNMMLPTLAQEAAADSVGRGLATAECVKAWLQR